MGGEKTTRHGEMANDTALLIHGDLSIRDGCVQLSQLLHLRIGIGSHRKME
jgi:hypothetical protein